MIIYFSLSYKYDTVLKKIQINLI